jgi:hypothetical protein
MNKSSRTVKLKGVLISYPNLAKPRAGQDGGEPKYSASFVLVPGPSFEANKTAINTAIAEVVEEGFGKSGKLQRAGGSLHDPLRTDAEDKGYPEGSLFINARTGKQPGFVFSHAGPVVGADGKAKPAVIPQDKIEDVLYAGAIVNAVVQFYAFDKEGKKKGVGVGLGNIQKVADGPRLDGRKSATDDFEADEALAPAELEDLE